MICPPSKQAVNATFYAQYKWEHSFAPCHSWFAAEGALTLCRGCALFKCSNRHYKANPFADILHIKNVPSCCDIPSSSSCKGQLMTHHSTRYHWIYSAHGRMTSQQKYARLKPNSSDSHLVSVQLCGNRGDSVQVSDSSYHLNKPLWWFEADLSQVFAVPISVVWMNMVSNLYKMGFATAREGLE